MDRRTVLTGMAFAGASAAMPSLAKVQAEAFFAEFQSALAQNPWLLGLSGVDEDPSPAVLTMEGTPPEDLKGRFYRNGPGLHARNDRRYHHWFDGDGLVNAYELGGGEISYRARFVRTAKFKAEQKAGRFLYSAAGTDLPGTLAITGPDDLNSANINILPLAGELLALWEGGSAHRLDPETLETLGVKTWRDDLAEMPFSAHPRVAPDGEVWNFGSFNGALFLYRIGADGALKKFGRIDHAAYGMIHDFFLTEKHVVFVLSPFDMEGTGEAFFGRMRFRSDLPIDVLVVSRDTFEIVRRYELPTGFWFHGGNAYEDADGVIHLDLSIAPDAAFLQAAVDIMKGDIGFINDLVSNIWLVSLYPDGKTAIEIMDGLAEFPRIDQRFMTRKTRYLFTNLATTGRTGNSFDAVRRIDIGTGAMDDFVYGPDFLAEEHIFAPRPGSAEEGDGWLIGTALHWPSKRTCVNIFHALNLADGPIVRAWLPFALPLGFHGQFVAAQ